MASETIREFLVTLGFKTDESALKKFDTGIRTATKSVLALAAAIEGSATLVAAGIAKFASNLEALYFAARRTGSSALQLKALDLAARNLGVSSGEAQAAVEGLASKLREGPGYVAAMQGQLAKLGFTMVKNKDGSINAADALLKLIKVYKTMPFWQAQQYGSLLGLNPDTLFQLMNGDLAGEFNKALKELAAGGFGTASESAHRLMGDLRELQAQFEVFATQAAMAIQEKLRFSLQDLRKWLEKNGPWLAKSFGDAAVQLIDWAKKIAVAISEVIDVLKRWDKETGGLSTKLIALAVLLKVTGLGSIIGGVLQLTAAFVGLAAGIGTSSAALSTLGVGLAAVSGWGIGKWLGKKNDELIQRLTGDKNSSLGNWWYDITHRDETAKLRFESQGWSPAAAAGIVGGLQGESGVLLSANAIGDSGKAYGIGQWHQDRQDLFKRLTGKDIHDSSFEEQLDFVDYELRNRPEYHGSLLRAAKSSDAAARIFEQWYERPDPNKLADAQDRAARYAVQLSPNTTIIINGVTDAKAAGKAVSDAQKEVNAKLARDMHPKVQ